MFKISKDLINNFSQELNLTAFNNAYSLAVYHIDQAMNNIMGHNAFIQDYQILVANEVFSGVECTSSSLDLFLCLNAKQLEINFEQDKIYNVKQSFKNFFKRFKENFTILKRKKNSAKKLQKAEKKILQDEKYNIKTFYNDFQIQLCKTLYTTTKTSLNKLGLKILQGDEFGIEVNIYPVFNYEEDLLKMYNTKNKKQIIINFNDRFTNYNNFNILTDDQFKTQIRIFNNVFYNMFNFVPNQIFIESLLYCVPVKLYTNNCYGTTINIVNYLKNCEIQKINSICNKYINVYDEPLNTTNLETAYKFIKALEIE